MGVDSDALTSLDNLKEALGIIGNQDDLLLERIINRTTDLFELWCDRRFKSASYTEYHDGKGLGRVFPKQFPVTAVASIYDDSEWTWGASTLVASTDYLIVDQAYVQLKASAFGDDVQNVKITYTGGYATIPGDLEQAAIDQASWAYRKAKGQLQGVQAKTLADGSISYTAREILPEVQAVLERYRRRRSAL